jgi:CRISPR-associated endoribonuclease Cas6
MPMIVHLRLRALNDVHLGPAHGEQTHAAFLALLARMDPALTTALHDAPGGRPFTAGTIGDWGRDGRRALRAGQTVSWRVSVLRDDVALAVCGALAFLPADEDGHIRIGAGRFAVESSSTRLADGGRTESFAVLLAEGARHAGCPTVDLEFVTPLAFSLGEQEWGGKRIELWPLPHLVFGSLARRWTEYAPPECALLPDLKEWIERTVLTARHNVRTVAITGAKGPQLGCIGMVSYRAMGKLAAPHDLYRAQWQALAAFASYSAVGYRTAMGWGQVRRVPPVALPSADRASVARGRTTTPALESEGALS